MILAAFVNPGLLTIGAAATAVPILIHLFARRRFKRIRWAAMDFLIDAEKRNRRRVRLEELILLALRCAAMALIAMMAARPFFSPSGAAAAWTGQARTERVFILDDSFSMGHENTGGTAFARGKQAVRQIIDALRRDTPDDTVTIVRTSAPAVPVELGTSLEDTQVEAMFARIEALSVSQRSMDPAHVVEAVTGLLSQTDAGINAAVYVISDFQRKDWAQRETALGQGGTSAAILEPLKKWAEDDRGLRLVLVNVGDAEASNRAVTQLGLEGGQLVAGAAATLRAQIANHAETPAENLELQLSVGALVQVGKSVGTLSPRGAADVELAAEFPRPGHESVRVEIPGDALQVDDVRYMAVEVAAAIRVVIVNGEASSDDFDDEVSFLKTALRPEGAVFSGNEVVVVDEAELDSINLSGFHAVVLANVYRVSDPAAEALERYVRMGGGVMIFLGDQVDAGLYNSVLFKDGDGLLPAALGDRVLAPTAAHLVISDRLHPALRGLAGEGDPLGLGQVPFFEFFSAMPPSDAAEALTDAVDPEKPQESRADGTRLARVLATFDDAERHPAIIERALGAGRVMLVNTTADKEWHSWPEHPTFLPVMMELVHHTARRADTGDDLWVGTALEVPLDPAAFEPDALVRTPLYPEEQEVSVVAQAAADEQGLAVRWEHTETSGIYQIVLRRHDGGEAVRLVAVNVDPRESDLSASDEPELRRVLGGVPFEYVEGLDQIANAAGEARVEFWRAALIAAVLVLMAEQSLAWHWGRKR